MLDIGWSEILVIAVVLIVVVGPKDLPPMLRAFGRMSRKFTAMAADFRKQFDDALNENDMGDLRKTISDVQRMHPGNAIREAMTPLRQAADDLKADIKKSVEAPIPSTAPADAATQTVAAAAVAATAVPASVPPVATIDLAGPTPAAEKPKRKAKAKAEQDPGSTGSEPVKKASTRKKADAASSDPKVPAAKPKKKTISKKDEA